MSLLSFHLLFFQKYLKVKMSVHYKFKSTLHFDTITFDGLHISVADLKKEIVQQKRLGKIIDFDLQITNAQNKEGKLFCYTVLLFLS